MYHSVLIVITHSTIYKEFKVQYVPSHSYLCYTIQECTYFVHNYYFVYCLAV